MDDETALAWYNSRKPLSKKTVLALKIPTWIQIKYLGASDSVVLFLGIYFDDKYYDYFGGDKKQKYKGDVYLKVYDPITGDFLDHIIHDQVMRILGQLEPPPLVKC